jgi:hypothetical protein
MSTETLTPTQLLVGNGPTRTKLVKVASGNTLAIGAALRRKLAAAIAEDGDNTGDGAAGAVTIGKKAKLGTYTLTCIVEAANGGTFMVVGPDGTRYADLTVAVAYDNGHFAVTIADGAEDFDLGDVFTVEVTDSGEVVPFDDADAMFAGILAEAVDASSAAAYGTSWLDGEFRRSAVTFPDGTTLTAAIEAALAAAGVQLKDTLG